MPLTLSAPLTRAQLQTPRLVRLPQAPRRLLVAAAPRPARPRRLSCKAFLQDAPPKAPPPPEPSEQELEVLERMVLDLAAEATARRGPGPPQPCEAELEAAQDIAMQIAVQETAIQSLPRLSAPVEVLRCDDGKGGTSTFYLLGTAHASKASCQDAGVLIEAVRPDVVMVELCIERATMLSMEKVEVPTLRQVLAAVQAGKVGAFAGLYTWLLAKVGAKLEVAPGEEFRVAAAEARSLGLQVALGDRPISITMARMWAALRWHEKARLLGSLLWSGLRPMPAEAVKQEIEAMKNEDVLTQAMERFGRDFPSVVRPLLEERNEYMAYIMTKKLAPRYHKVVVVVGAGHLQGIKEKWEAEIDIQELMRVP